MARRSEQHEKCEGGLSLSEIAELGKWCSEQRQARKKGMLTNEQIAKLDSLGFDWEEEEEPNVVVAVRLDDETEMFGFPLMKSANSFAKDCMARGAEVIIGTRL